MSREQAFNNNSEEPSWNNNQLDDSAFEEFFKRNFTRLCAHCSYKFGFNLEVAEDIVQNSFIKLWENRQSVSGSVSLKKYLYKIIYNSSLDLLKHEKVKEKHIYFIREALPDEEATAFEMLDLKQLSASIDEAVAGLPEQMRKIYELSRYEGLKYKAIAIQLNISIKTVENQMSRALLKLREKLLHHLPLLLVVLSSVESKIIY